MDSAVDHALVRRCDDDRMMLGEGDELLPSIDDVCDDLGADCD